MPYTTLSPTYANGQAINYAIVNTIIRNLQLGMASKATQRGQIFYSDPKDNQNWLPTDPVPETPSYGVEAYVLCTKEGKLFWNPVIPMQERYLRFGLGNPGSDDYLVGKGDITIS